MQRLKIWQYHENARLQKPNTDLTGFGVSGESDTLPFISNGLANCKLAIAS